MLNALAVLSALNHLKLMNNIDILKCECVFCCTVVDGCLNRKAHVKKRKSGGNCISYLHDRNFVPSQFCEFQAMFEGF